MKPAEHCLLCEHRESHFQTGAICGLTGIAPNFKGKCDVIDLGNTLKSKIEEVNVALHLVEQTKAATIVNALFFTGISLAVAYGGFALNQYVLEMGYLAAMPWVIVVLGISILGLAIGPVNKYRTRLQIAQGNKRMVDDVVTVYGLDYDIQLKIDKGPHDILDISSKIAFKKRDSDGN